MDVPGTARNRVMAKGSLKLAFRADASLDIGIGHVMRCLTLADALKQEGSECHFICRQHQGHLLETIRRRGHKAHALPAADERSSAPTGQEQLPAHAAWLGCEWRTDAAQTRKILADIEPDWLVVDHYALDTNWEGEARPFCRKLMVIDDLADRPHTCDLLLDQTLGRTPEDYRGLVGNTCTILAGSGYALLRPEFAAWRDRSLKRRSRPELHHILVSMGGVDPRNVTGEILEALAGSPQAHGCRVSVVIGSRAPWLVKVQEQARTMPFPTEVHVDLGDMARLMASADLAVGAAGTTSWERCCLGLPALVLVLAENQRSSAEALERAGAAVTLDAGRGLISELRSALDQYGRYEKLLALARAASGIVDGNGANRVLRHLRRSA
jgi:UDP-2,4-diacetamido-2,4,6-trideoxy-beta-L-altropyranose hydrolase